MTMGATDAVRANQMRTQALDVGAGGDFGAIRPEVVPPQFVTHYRDPAMVFASVVGWAFGAPVERVGRSPPGGPRAEVIDLDVPGA